MTRSVEQVGYNVVTTGHRVDEDYEEEDEDLPVEEVVEEPAHGVEPAVHLCQNHHVIPFVRIELEFGQLEQDFSKTSKANPDAVDHPRDRVYGHVDSYTDVVKVEYFIPVFESRKLEGMHCARGRT